LFAKIARVDWDDIFDSILANDDSEALDRGLSQSWAVALAVRDHLKWDRTSLPAEFDTALLGCPDFFGYRDGYPCQRRARIEHHLDVQGALRTGKADGDSLFDHIRHPS
jgi:hypothetical protein